MNSSEITCWRLPMTKLIHAANHSETGLWLKDIAALASIGAFLWVAATWVQIAHLAAQA